MQRTCPKCQFVNNDATGTTFEACPACGVIYAKAMPPRVTARRVDPTSPAAPRPRTSVPLGYIVAIAASLLAGYFIGREHMRLQAAMPIAGSVTPPAKNQTEINAVETLKHSLKDPSSAQFQNLRTVQAADGTIAVCGEVNARNGMGGYMGFSRFMVLGEKSMIQSSDRELALIQMKAFEDCADWPPTEISEDERESLRSLLRE